MRSALHKRLERLEALLAARVSPPIWKWSFGDTDDAHLVADVPERDRHRVQIWRWLDAEEARARGMELPQIHLHRSLTHRRSCRRRKSGSY